MDKVYCNGCKYCDNHWSDMGGHVEECTLYSVKVDTPFQWYLVHPNLNDVNKNNDCTEWVQKKRWWAGDR